MLADKKLKAFVPTVKSAEAKDFYQDVLGLTLLSEDNFALEFGHHRTARTWRGSKILMEIFFQYLK